MKEVIKIDNDLFKIILKNKHIKVELLNLGASILSFYYKDVDIVVGPKDLNYFTKGDHHYGKTVGRFCGRLPSKGVKIKDKEIVLPPYRSDNATIHGGKNGYARRYFNYVETEANEVVFTLLDKSSDSYLPGDVTLKITYRLEEETLHVFYEATTTETTILNITNHSYFNLDGSKTIENHYLQVDAPNYVKFSPTYEVLGVEEVNNTLFDLRKPTLLSGPLEKLKDSPFRGFDTIYLFDKNKKVQLYSELSQINLTVETNYPSIVIFTHNNPSPDSVKYFSTRAYHGVALECMYEPGGILSPYLNDAILTKDKTFNHFITYKLSQK